jgi:hypothetical protein
LAEFTFPKVSWYRVRNWLLKLWDIVPFLGRLDFRNGKAWGRAVLETVLSVVLSSIPLWVAISALCWTDLEPTLRSAANYVVRNGELLLLSGSAVSPIVYVTSVSYRSPHPKPWLTTFPHGAYYLLGSVIILIMSVVYITVQTTFSHPGPGARILNPRHFDLLSWVLYLSSLFLFFTASIHRNCLEADNPLEAGKQSEQDFEARWANRNG